ncbi:hypothetical protein [Micromonospora maritima]|uniref:hypothetical protein n=1 Tax=Micromonospora maritima TaxID=986711 RepID=UPI00157D7212|nr:hypothetical protein [Micromonospora maritima]
MAGTDQITVQVIRPPRRDGFGDPLPGSGDTFEIPGCLFAPGPTTEVLDGANQVLTDGAIYAPPGAPSTDVKAGDKVRVRADLYEVDGKPQDWGSAGVVILLRLITG